MMAPPVPARAAGRPGCSTGRSAAAAATDGARSRWPAGTHRRPVQAPAWRPRVVATGRRDRRSRPRMPRWRSSPAGVHRAARPGSPAPRWWRRPAGRPARGCGAPGSGEEVKLLLRSGKARRARGAHPTMPGRPPMRLCGRSSPISRQPAGMVTHQTFAPRGRKIIWRNRRKSPKNVSVTTPNRRPAQFCVGVHVQCVSDRARTARPRIRDASGAQT